MEAEEDTPTVKSERNLNTVQYLLDKDLSLSRRKVSEYAYNHATHATRENFVLAHRAETYTAFRAYIDSLYSPHIRLYYSKFEPSRKDATVCIVHGYGQNSDNFIPMAEYFAQNGFVVNMVDLRGFGYSGGTRVFESFRGLLSDIENLLRRCCQKGLPTYLLGHGFGSLLILGLLQENPGLPLSGVIILSPLFKFPCFRDIGVVDRVLLQVLSEVWPHLLISNNINPTALTNNPHKVKNCLDGVFNYQYISISMAQNHTRLSEKVLQDAHKFKYPLLMLYGSNDTVQSIHEVKAFYRLVASKEKSSFVFKNGYHHLHDDQQAEKEVFPKVIEWIFDINSNKNQVKWTVTSPFTLQLSRPLPLSLKYALLVLLPLAVAILLKLLSYLRRRTPSH